MSIWINNLRTAMQNKEVIILYGNVRDRYISENGTLYENLTSLIRSEVGGDYSRKVFYDIWDQQRIEPADPNRPPQNPDVPPTSPLAQWKNLLNEQALEPTLITIFYFDKLTQFNETYDIDERKILVLLEKIIENISPRNRLILVSLDLSLIPVELYRFSPKIHLIPIPLPEKKDRAKYFTQILQIRDEKLINLLANLTDGLFLRDLSIIAREIAQYPNPGEQQIIRIIKRYKIGEQPDHWGQLSVARIEDSVRWFIDEEGVKGQNEALINIKETLMLASTNIIELASGSGAKPRGVFFFAGPSGVGKTLVAKKMARFLFSSEDAFIRFDMSEFQEEHTLSKLIGSPPGYVGHDAGGRLTNALRQRPFSVVLFDEIEKAHPRILDIFLQILDDGRLTDSNGQTVYFSEAVIIFTSNLGTRNKSLKGIANLNEILQDIGEYLMSEDEGSDQQNSQEAVIHLTQRLFEQLKGSRELSEKDILNEILTLPAEFSNDPSLKKRAIRSHFAVSVRNFFRYEISRPELLNRIEDDIIPFNYIDSSEIQLSIINSQLEKFRVAFDAEYTSRNFTFTYSDDLSGYILNRYGTAFKEFGGRKIFRILRKKIFICVAGDLKAAMEAGRNNQSFHAHINQNQIEVTCSDIEIPEQ